MDLSWILLKLASINQKAKMILSFAVLQLQNLTSSLIRAETCFSSSWLSMSQVVFSVVEMFSLQSANVLGFVLAYE